tara:strand:+ start:538 stop:714 length:177 start_codon:yes stop_codon:yes gene_type:complete
MMGKVVMIKIFKKINWKKLFKCPSFWAAIIFVPGVLSATLVFLFSWRIVFITKKIKGV